MNESFWMTFLNDICNCVHRCSRNGSFMEFGRILWARLACWCSKIQFFFSPFLLFVFFPLLVFRWNYIYTSLKCSFCHSCNCPRCPNYLWCTVNMLIKKNLPCTPPNPTNTPACPAAFRRTDKICIYWVNVCLWFWNCCNQSHSNACIESVFFDNKQILKENEIKSFFKLVGFHCSLLLIGDGLFKWKGIICFWQNQRVHFIPLQQCSGCLSSCRAARLHRRLPLY